MRCMISCIAFFFFVGVGGGIKLNRANVVQLVLNPMARRAAVTSVRRSPWMSISSSR